jgi:hypothetical protein
MFLTNCSVRTKIMLGFLVITAFTTVLGIVSLLEQGKVVREAEGIGTDLLPSLVHLSRIETSLNNIRRGDERVDSQGGAGL